MMTHITSAGVLVWAKRVEAQMAQAAGLNTLTESRQFDKVKISKKKQKMTWLELQLAGPHSNSCVDTVGEHTSQDSAWHMATCVQDVARWDSSKRSAIAKEVGQ